MTLPRHLAVVGLITWGAWRMLEKLNACTAEPGSSFWRCAVPPLFAMAVGSAVAGFVMLLTDYLYHHSRPALFVATLGIIAGVVQFPAFSAGLGIVILALSRSGREPDTAPH